MGVYTFLKADDVHALLRAHPDPEVVHLAQDLQEMAAELLLARMREYGRLILKNANDLELSRLLWQAIVEGAEVLGEAEVDELQRLAETADGWWRIGGEVPEFTELKVWLADYREMSR